MPWLGLEVCSSQRRHEEAVRKQSAQTSERRCFRRGTASTQTLKQEYSWYVQATARRAQLEMNRDMELKNIGLWKPLFGLWPLLRDEDPLESFELRSDMI